MAVNDGDTGPLGDAIGLLGQGGPVTLILIDMSVLALTILIIKVWHMRHLGSRDLSVAEQAMRQLREGNAGRALAVTDAAGGPVATMVWHAIQGRRLAASDALVREEIERLGLKLLTGYRSWLRPLEVIAALAPLLGLFGTVLGMIEAFRQMELAGSQINPALLSGGIWEALLTTAVGLAVAIPTVVALNWLERRVERTANAMDDMVTRVFTGDLAMTRMEEARYAGADAQPLPLR